MGSCQRLFAGAQEGSFVAAAIDPQASYRIVAAKQGGSLVSIDTDSGKIVSTVCAPGNCYYDDDKYKLSQ
jgi:hypothetical protein